MWKMSPSYGDAEGQTPPNCPRCRKPVRRQPFSAKRYRSHSAANPPWNSGWNGLCEQCGFAFSLDLVDDSFSPMVTRTVHVRPANAATPLPPDSAVVTVGLEIQVTESTPQNAQSSTTTVFLRMDEVAQLIQALHGPMSVAFEQYSWAEDWT